MTRTWTIGLALAFAIGGPVTAADWPQWRGPRGSGVTDERNLPVRWSATENVAWKAPIAGHGVSTPIVSGDRIFITSQIGAGARRPGNHPRLAQGGDAAALGERPLGGSRGATAEAARPTFVVEAFHRQDGRRVWEYRLEAADPMPAVHDKHNMASPSPVTDGQLVFAWFSTGQLVALDMNGRPLWQRHLGREISPFTINWGHGSSPVIYQDLLILLCDHTPAAYLLALDKKTGKERWKADRGRGRSSYSTPLVVPAPGGGAEIIVNSSERVDAYDAKTGEFLWHVGGTNQFPIPSPVFHDGVVYMNRGYRSSPYLAVRPGGRGDVSGSHVAWQAATGGPYVSSVVYDSGLLYMANDVGVLTAANAKSGEKVWQERVGGVFSASPVAADDKVYFVSETGETFVVSSGPKPSVIARNDLGERALASPALSNGQIFIRTDEHLFCIGKPVGRSGRTGDQ
ncbi:MAG: PQQ-binding-like beta-propeller repeat protein [Acidobacteria bacterium]|nr:PQQ-binding-like beta-propeller repeat protein [Acidobacteriota bacterium]